MRRSRGRTNTHRAYRALCPSIAAPPHGARAKRLEHDPPLTCTKIRWEGGTTEFAAHLEWLTNKDGGIKFGTMVAGNSGRIAGGCGDTINMRFRSIHPEHTTQEESIVSNWVTTMETKKNVDREVLFRQLLDGNGKPRWGLIEPVGASRATYQGKDYTVAEPSDYFEAWEVPGAYLSGSEGLFATDLVFVAGPNVGSRGTKTGSMTRTFYTALTTYEDFREAVKQAVRAGLIKMNDLECEVALVAGVSTGIYAGQHSHRINKEFVDLVNEILYEEISLRKRRNLKLVYYVTKATDNHWYTNWLVQKLNAAVQTLS